MASRQQNESKFRNWDNLPDGGRRYWYNVAGRNGWQAHYVKIVDASEQTLRFYQEILDNNGTLVSLHEKYPQDFGHRKPETK